MMAKKEEKKGLFSKAVDALSNRDEKAAAEAAQRAESEAKVKAAAAEREAEKAKAAAAEAAAKLKAMEAEKAKEKAQQDRIEAAKKADEWRAKQAEAAKPKIIAEHKLTETETLSHLSLKYYGSAIRDYWMVIYEENKEEIGDNPAHVRVGMTIRIPELPEELKKDK
jgi:nucleoid-associated protein YgaU